eukprot:jgi/Chlat1/6186/Chrsp42S09037
MWPLPLHLLVCLSFTKHNPNTLLLGLLGTAMRPPVSYGGVVVRHNNNHTYTDDSSSSAVTALWLDRLSLAAAHMAAAAEKGGLNMSGSSGKVVMVNMNYRCFEEARAYVRTLGLRTVTEFRRWSRSGARPADIPSDPYKAYIEHGWETWMDFLGTTRERYLPYSTPSPSPHTNTNTSTSTSTLNTTPNSTNNTVEDNSSISDLGGGSPTSVGRGASITPHSPPHSSSHSDPTPTTQHHHHHHSFLPFHEARAYVWKLGLTTQAEYRAWRKGAHRPPNVPTAPDKIYLHNGWISWPDFLGRAKGKPPRMSRPRVDLTLRL